MLEAEVLQINWMMQCSIEMFFSTLWNRLGYVFGLDEEMARSDETGDVGE